MSDSEVVIVVQKWNFYFTVFIRRNFFGTRRVIHGLVNKCSSAWALSLLGHKTEVSKQHKAVCIYISLYFVPCLWSWILGNDWKNGTGCWVRPTTAGRLYCRFSSWCGHTKILKNSDCGRSSLVLGVNGECKQKIHVPCSHWLATNAPFTAKTAAMVPDAN